MVSLQRLFSNLSSFNKPPINHQDPPLIPHNNGEEKAQSRSVIWETQDIVCKYKTLKDKQNPPTEEEMQNLDVVHGEPFFEEDIKNLWYENDVRKTEEEIKKDFEIECPRCQIFIDGNLCQSSQIDATQNELQKLLQNHNLDPNTGMTTLMLVLQPIIIAEFLVKTLPSLEKWGVTPAEIGKPLSKHLQFFIEGTQPDEITVHMQKTLQCIKKDCTEEKLRFFLKIEARCSLKQDKQEGCCLKEVFCSYEIVPCEEQFKEFEKQYPFLKSDIIPTIFNKCKDLFTPK